MKIKVITDSTSDIPHDVAEKLDIRVVPIYVRFGENTYRDGIDISSDQFYSMLTSSAVHPATSQPTPEDFTNTYKEYSDTYDGIVSIHISSRISGTYNSALIAKQNLKNQCPIEIIDSKFNSAGLGLIVRAAARVAQSGANFADVINEVNKAINEVSMLGMFATMKYLARSGRVNKAIAQVAGIIHVMPLLTFRDGEIIRAGLTRTVSNGMNRICNFVRQNIPINELIIVHSVVEDQAIKLKQQLNKYIEEEKISIYQLGAGLGANGGPGVLLAAIR